MEQGLINRDNVLKGIEELKQSSFVKSHDSYVRHMMRETLDVVAKLVIEAQPTVEAEPIRHGKWVYEKRDKQLHCSNCGNVRWFVVTPYCPFCGTKMDGAFAEDNNVPSKEESEEK